MDPSPEDDFLLQAQRKAKREFLAEEIVAQGYSTQLFTQFCEERRGSDIDIWDIEALTECVREFKARHRPGEEVFEDLTVSQPPEDAALRLAEDEYWVQSVLLAPTKLSDAEIGVALHSPEILSASLLSRPRLYFVVDTAPLGWSVKRCAEDCLWLRSTLQVQFPGEVVPPLVEKKDTVNEARWMQKRLSQLQFFCEEVVFSPIFRSSSFVVSFLSDSQTRFQESKKAALKLRRPLEAEHMPSIYGKLRCCTGNSSFFAELGKDLAQAEAVERQLKRQSAAVAGALDAATCEIDKLTQGVNSLVEVLTVPLAAELRDQMQALALALSAWSKYQSQVSSSIQGTLRLVFAHKCRQVAVMREMLRERDNIQATYNSAEAKLNERKERLWQQGDVSKWELPKGANSVLLQQSKDLAFPCMLSRDSQLVQRQRDLLGFYNSQVRRLPLATPLDARRLSGLADDFRVCLAALDLEWRTFTSKVESFPCTKLYTS